MLLFLGLSAFVLVRKVCWVDVAWLLDSDPLFQKFASEWVALTVFAGLRGILSICQTALHTAFLDTHPGLYNDLGRNPNHNEHQPRSPFFLLTEAMSWYLQLKAGRLYQATASRLAQQKARLRPPYLLFLFVCLCLSCTLCTRSVFK